MPRGDKEEADTKKGHRWVAATSNDAGNTARTV
jgi:hypothetical protein